MLKAFCISAVFLASVAVFPALSYSQSSQSGQPASQSAYNASASSTPPAQPAEIHVDQHCRILPDPAPALAAGAKPPHPHRDHVVCHLESVLRSSHIEETTVAGKRHQIQVKVAEQEYLLQNVTPEPVVFIVEQPVDKDWRVDSDPAPTAMVPQPVASSGQIALFRVDAQPRQIVRLHVGLRHEWPKAKPASLPPATPGVTPNPPGSTAPNSTKPA